MAQPFAITRVNFLAVYAQNASNKVGSLNSDLPASSLAKCDSAEGSPTLPFSSTTVVRFSNRLMLLQPVFDSWYSASRRFQMIFVRSCEGYFYRRGT